MDIGEKGSEKNGKESEGGGREMRRGERKDVERCEGMEGRRTMGNGGMENGVRGMKEKKEGE